MMMNSNIGVFEKSIEETLYTVCKNPKDKKFIVALSGGADSVSLLLAMIKLSNKIGFTVYACHVNHMIRGEEADRDEKFCSDLCAEKGVKLFVLKKNIPLLAKETGESIELCARNFRYSSFENLCEEHDIDYICTAHNANDNAETVLFNIVRGTGISGLSGIPVIRGRIIRPIINITRQEILSYLSKHKQSFVTDSTNSDIDYTRNYIRNVLIPCASKINPEVISALNRLSVSAKQDSGYLDALAKEVVINKCKRLVDYPYALKIRIIKLRYSEYSNKELSFKNIVDICDCLQSNEESRCNLPDGIVAVCNYGNISFEKSLKEVNKIKEQKLVIGNNSICDGISIHIDFSENEKAGLLVAALPLDTNISSLKVRSRKEGDKFIVRGINRTIKKCLIDKKVPAKIRDLIPVIEDKEGIVFVPFIGTADRVYKKGPALRISVLFDERFGF